MTQSHVLIGGLSTFFQMAAHLCDACVVLSADVAKDASRMDKYIGRHWPRGNEFVKLHHGSAGEEPFDGNLFGRALAKVLAAPEPSPVTALEPSPSPSPGPPGAAARVSAGQRLV